MLGLYAPFCAQARLGRSLPALASSHFSQRDVIRSSHVSNAETLQKAVHGYTGSTTMFLKPDRIHVAQAI